MTTDNWALRNILKISLAYLPHIFFGYQKLYISAKTYHSFFNSHTYLLWQKMYSYSIFTRICPKFYLCQHLIGKRIAHNKTGMSHGTPQIHQPALCQKYNMMSIFQCVAVHLNESKKTKPVRTFFSRFGKEKGIAGRPDDTTSQLFLWWTEMIHWIFICNFSKQGKENWSFSLLIIFFTSFPVKIIY